MVQDLAFRIAIGWVGRVLMLRDRILGQVERRNLEQDSRVLVEQVAIACGTDTLDAALVRPALGSGRAHLLICHGIGETVEHWLGVQRLLGGCGVVSLVFNYSGYGRSTGRLGVGACERNAAAAFKFLEEVAGGGEVTVLGYSLGSGIAAAIGERVGASRLVLCAVYPSLRRAAGCAGVPEWMAAWLPDAWRTVDRVRECRLPVLIAQGGMDRLFPPGVAREVAAAGGEACELIIVPGLSHNGPMDKPEMAYWSLIMEWLGVELIKSCGTD